MATVARVHTDAEIIYGEGFDEKDEAGELEAIKAIARRYRELMLEAAEEAA